MKRLLAVTLVALSVSVSARQSAAVASVTFVDVAEAVGLSYILHGGTAEKRHIPEAMPGGIAWIDYDLDGDQDLFACTGGKGPPPAIGSNATPGLSPRMFRNELVETGEARFTDVTEALGFVDSPGWGMGVSVADYDGDGDLDVYETRLGPNRLHRNELVTAEGEKGAPRFVEVAGAAGVADASWGTGSAFADVDGDGDLDLFVANYVAFDPAEKPANPMFSHWRGIDVFPGPVGLTGAPDRFYRNMLVESGSATFEDASQVSGLADAEGSYGFAVLFTDFDLDGDQDLYIANDSRPNRLHRNDGKGRFEEIGFLAGGAYSEDGKMQAGMGAAAGDCDGDGRVDLHVTNFSYDYNALYRNVASGFEDVSYSSGIGRPSWHDLGFGTLFLDVDGDGDEDLFVANGHIYPQVDRGDFHTSYAQRNRLFLNGGKPGRCSWVDATASAGAGLALARVSRGAAAADYDGDGDLDILVSELDARPTLLRNDTAGHGSWLVVRCLGEAPNRWGVGARVSVEAEVREQVREQVREIRTSASYLCAEPLLAHFGLASSGSVRVTVRFPSGRVVTRAGVKTGQKLVVEEPAAD